MRSLRLLLSAAVVVACSDFPAEPTVSPRTVTVVSRGLSSVDWVKSSTGMDMVVLGRFNGGDVLPLDINDAGQVVGRYLADTPDGAMWRAFLWQNGVFTDLGTLGGSSSVAHQINEAGVIVGWASIEEGLSRPVMWKNGQIMQLLPPDEAGSGIARAINEDGTIVGTYNNRAVRWSGNDVIVLDMLPGSRRSGAQGINGHGTIVGSGFVTSPFSQPPWIWSNGTLAALSVPPSSILAGLWLESSRVFNDRGDFLGTTTVNSPFSQRGFIVRGGELTVLPQLFDDGGADVVIALGLNENSDVAGFEELSDGAWRGVVWKASGKSYDLGLPPGAGGSQARGINNEGLVVGYASETDMFGTAKYSGVIWRLPPPDDTPPLVESTVSGTLGANGWYVSDVQVTWQVSDAESGVGQTAGCDAAVVNQDTPGIEFTCTASNGVGLSLSRTVVVKRDVTPPVVSFSQHPALYTLDQTVTIECAASDATSGIATSSCERVSRSALEFGLGTHTLAASAQDNAGNQASASTSFTVLASYSGLAALTRMWMTNEQLAELLAKLVITAEEAAQQGKPHLARAGLQVYIFAVSRESGRSLTAEQAKFLIELARALMEDVVDVIGQRELPRRDPAPPGRDNEKRPVIKGRSKG